MKKNRIFIIILLVLSLFVCVFTTDINVTASSDYYSSVSSSLTGNSLKNALRNVITSTHKYKSSYDDCKDPNIVKKTDGNTASTKIVLFWSGINIFSNNGI